MSRAARIQLTSADGHRFSAWRADPAGPARGGIVILHAVYGLTDHMGDVCDGYAARGYAAIAPALYDRLQPGMVHAYTAAGVTAGSAAYAALTREQILADVAACAAALRGDGGAPRKVAISGFCTGGTWAWIAAAELPFDAQVNFYGSQVPAHLDRLPRCPTLMHYGDSDHVVSVERIARIRAAVPDAELHVYPGGQHAFFNRQQASYDAAHAALAMDRTIAFLDRQLGA